MRRLVLFDIDGTLVTGGPAKGAFRHALLEVFGTAGPIEGWEFSGKTDPQIARELLTEAGLDRTTIDAGFPDLWRHYLGEMERRLPGRPTRALPGVEPLLDGLESEGGSALGLLTGNVAGGAKLKLGAAGIGRRLTVGAFGSDHEVRNELPTIARRRAREHWGIDFGAPAVVIVGDTPRDVACGRAHGIRTVAVATGRFGADALRETGADVVLESFEETETAMRAILDFSTSNGGGKR